jgi:hypothetical protein
MSGQKQQGPGSSQTLKFVLSVTRRKPAGVRFLLGMLLVAVAPIAYLVSIHGISPLWFLIGAAAWALGLLVKLPLTAWVPRVKRWIGSKNAPLSGHAALAVVAGVLSGLAELGIAFLMLYLLIPLENVAVLIAFGVGAGSIEVLYLLLILTPREVQRALESGSLRLRDQASPPPPGVALWSILERAYATVIHTTTRGLVAVSILGSNPLPALLGLLAFTLVDGAASFGDLRGWNWQDTRILRRFHAFGLGVAALGVVWFTFFLKMYNPR